MKLLISLCGEIVILPKRYKKLFDALKRTQMMVSGYDRMAIESGRFDASEVMKTRMKNNNRFTRLDAKVLNLLKPHVTVSLEDLFIDGTSFKDEYKFYSAFRSNHNKAPIVEVRFE